MIHDLKTIQDLATSSTEKLHKRELDHIFLGIYEAASRGERYYVIMKRDIASINPKCPLSTIINYFRFKKFLVEEAVAYLEIKF